MIVYRDLFNVSYLNIVGSVSALSELIRLSETVFFSFIYLLTDWLTGPCVLMILFFTFYHAEMNTGRSVARKVSVQCSSFVSHGMYLFYLKFCVNWPPLERNY